MNPDRIRRVLKRGDLVRVRGFEGDENVLRVWDVLADRGVVLCSRGGYRRLRLGMDAALVGYPMKDVVGRISPPLTPAQIAEIVMREE